MSYPDKPAITNLPIAEIIKNRWSPRLFLDKPIEQEKINCLFEAVRWTPSSFNDQPWRLVYATQESPDEFRNLADLLLQGNDWAKKAPMLILVLAKENQTSNGLPNPKSDFDAGAATLALSLEATHQGLYVHQMGGFNVEKAGLAVNAPIGYKPQVMVAVGYIAPLEELQKQPEEFQKRDLAERSRLPIEQIVFKGKFNS